MAKSYLKDPLNDPLRIHEVLWDLSNFHANFATWEALGRMEKYGAKLVIYENRDGETIIRIRITSPRCNFAEYQVHLHNYTLAYARKKNRDARLDLVRVNCNFDDARGIVEKGQQPFTPRPKIGEYKFYVTEKIHCILTQDWIHGRRKGETINPGKCICKKCLKDQKIDQP